MTVHTHHARDLVTLLRDQAAAIPHRVAYHYVGSTEGPRSLTFAQLRDSAWAIAAELRQRAEHDDRVMLLFPPGLEFIQAFMGTVCAGAIAVPAPPPNPHRPERSLQRLESIVRSAEPRFVLTVSSVISALEPYTEKHPDFAGIEWIAVDAHRAPSTEAPPAADPDDIALLQYTSGSTSDPKGVMLSHGNVMHNVHSFDDGWDHGESSVLVSWLPAFHDLGLIYGVLMPLYGGFLGVQMSPIDVIQRPFSWLATMTKFRATHSSGPNFVYDLCTRKITDRELSRLELSHWRVALTAAEPVRAETMERFSERFASAGFDPSTFCPGYGLSEGTCKIVAVAAEDEALILDLRPDLLERHIVQEAADGEPARRVVGCGKAGPDISVTIVDPDVRVPCEEGRVGEIWVTGPAVARGYWGQPEASERDLAATLLGKDSPPHLRTGDLGFVKHGELFVTGRIKDMLIVRGANHYPQDIEHTVEDAHSSVRAGCCAVFAYEEDGVEHVAVIAELEGRWTEALRSASDPESKSHASDAAAIGVAKVSIVKAVASEHGIRVHRIALIPAGSILKTTSGKIRRQGCKHALLSGAFDVYVSDPSGTGDAPDTTGYERIIADVSRIVCTCADIPPARLRPDASLQGYGIDSLARVNIAYELSLLTSTDIPETLLSELDSVRDVVDYLLTPKREVA